MSRTPNYSPVNVDEDSGYQMDENWASHADQPSERMAARQQGVNKYAIIGLLLGVGIVGIVCLSVFSGSSQPAVSAVSDVAATPAGDAAELSEKAKTRAERWKVCNSVDFTKTFLKTAKEVSSIAMFSDNKGVKKFEASGIAHYGDDFYVVFDNLHSIGRIKYNLPFDSEANQLVGVPGEDSGYEEIYYDQVNHNFVVVVEAVVKDKAYKALIKEVIINDHSITEVSVCPSEFEFESENKGFEGAAPFHHEGKNYILALCEGNHCGAGAKGRDAGNGRIVVMERGTSKKDGKCQWNTVKMINIPKTANFVDYSAMSLKQDGTWKTAITSQESAEVWIGTLDPKKLEFDEGVVYNFPRDNDCEKIYCNIEGVQWFKGTTMLAAVSDKMKSGARQNFRCMEKDQSVHLFVLP